VKTRSKVLLWAAGVTSLVLVVAVGVIALVGGSATATLRVAVSGLPAAVPAALTVRGPITYTISGADERKVPAGAYSIQIPPVRTSLGLAYADTDQQQVTVPAGQQTATAVDYSTIVPDTTKILDYTNPGIVSAAGRQVVFAANSQSRRALVPGNIFVVAEGPQTPYPLARRIDSVTPTAAGLVVQTTPVDISQALPAAHFDLDPTAATSIQPAFYQGPPKPEFSFDFGKAIELYAKWEAGEKGGIKAEGSCDSAGLKVPRLALAIHNLSPKFGGSFKWGLAPPKVSISLTATLNPQISFDGEVAAALKCELRFEKAKGFALLNQLCDKVIGKLVRVGPVSLRCKLSPHVSVKVETEAATTLGFDATLHGGVKNSRPAFGVSDIRTRNLAQQIIAGASHSATVGGELGLGFTLEGGDPTRTAWLGLTVEIGAGPEFTAQGKSASLALVFRLELTAQMELDLRFKNYGKKRTLATFGTKFPLWHSTDGKFQTPAPPRALQVGRLRLAAPPSWLSNVVPERYQRSGFWVTTGRACPGGESTGGCPGVMVLDQSWITGAGRYGATAPYRLNQPAAWMDSQDEGFNCPPAPRLGAVGTQQPELLASRTEPVGGRPASYREWRIQCAPRTELMGGRPEDANQHASFVERSWYLPDEQVLIVDDWQTPALPAVLRSATWT
jgi:hypothetical protein